MEENKRRQVSSMDSLALQIPPTPRGEHINGIEIV